MKTSMSATQSQRQEAKAAIQAGRFADAITITKDLLAIDPSDTEALYLHAVAARYSQNYPAAHIALNNLKRISPDYGRAFQEEGHLWKAEGKPAEALAAFQLATRYNAALSASWAEQAKLLEAAGQSADAALAARQLQRLNSLPRELLAVTNHIYEGRIFRAEELARNYLQKNPHHVEGMRLLADIGSRLGVHEDADFLLNTAIKLEPDNIQLQIDYIQVLRKRQKFAAALEAAEALVRRDPDSAVFQSLLAIECMQAGQYERALNLFYEVLQKAPNDAATLTSRGHALKTYGQSDRAVTSYKTAVHHHPLHGDAWYALANLKTYTFSEDEIASMQAAIARTDLPFMSRVHLSFALGKAYEDIGDTTAAFDAYASGNALKRQQTRYTTEQMQEELAAQKRYCTPALITAQSEKGCTAPDPIFIVGLPRAGSTLIEQILASHSQVDGTLELPDILSLAHRLRGRNQVTERDRYPRILHDLTQEQLKDLGQTYIENTRLHRKGAAFFTDKMPNNFRHIGLIHLILPNAKIIDARRDPMDCCWSGFKQLFAEGQEFTYGLEDIGAYYRAYVDLMEHWNEVLPTGRILKVQHEDVLDDLDGQVRRILDYCNLSFEPECVEFHKTDRAIRTASSEQVRQPISKRGVGQWRPFEAHLDPLKQALGPLSLT